MNKEQDALERKLEIRHRELMEAHGHIAVLEGYPPDPTTAGYLTPYPWAETGHMERGWLMCRAYMGRSAGGS